MANSRIMIIIVIVFIVLAFVGSTYNQDNTSTTWAGNSQTSTLEYLMNFKNSSQEVSVLGTSIQLPFTNTQYWKKWGELVMLRFPFLIGTSGGEMFWRLVLMPLAFLGVLSLVLLGIAVIQGNISWG